MSLAKFIRTSLVSLIPFSPMALSAQESQQTLDDALTPSTTECLSDAMHDALPLTPTDSTATVTSGDYFVNNFNTGGIQNAKGFQLATEANAWETDFYVTSSITIQEDGAVTTHIRAEEGPNETFGASSANFYDTTRSFGESANLPELVTLTATAQASFDKDVIACLKGKTINGILFELK